MEQFNVEQEIQNLLLGLKRNPNETEFIQAVKEVAATIVLLSQRTNNTKERSF